MYPCVLGVDPSLSGTGVALIDTEFNIKTCLLKPSIQRGMKAEGKKRIVYYSSVFEQILLRERPSYVYIEDYAFAAHSAAYDMGELGGVYRILFQEYFEAQQVAYLDHFVKIAPPSLKKFVTGKGNAKKDQMLAALSEIFHLEIKDDNIGDAVGLALIGMSQKYPELYQQWAAKL